MLECNGEPIDKCVKLINLTKVGRRSQLNTPQLFRKKPDGNPEATLSRVTTHRARASDWLRVITWTRYWSLIGWEWPHTRSRARVNICVLCALTSVSFTAKVKSILRWLMLMVECQINWYICRILTFFEKNKWWLQCPHWETDDGCCASATAWCTSKCNETFFWPTKLQPRVKCLCNPGWILSQKQTSILSYPVTFSIVIYLL